MQQLASGIAESHQNLMDRFDAIDTQLKHMCLVNGGLAIGSVSKKEILVANAVDYMVAGKLYSLASAEHAFTATTHDITNSASAVQEAVYLLSVDSAGTVTVTMGDVATGSGNAVIPATPDDEAAIGYLRLAVAAGATPFDATSDDLDAAHLTDTYVNLGYRSARFDSTTTF